MSTSIRSTLIGGGTDGTDGADGAAGKDISGYLDPYTLTSATGITWDVNSGVSAYVDLEHTALITLTNMDNGQSASLAGTVVGTGNHSLTVTGAGLSVYDMNTELVNVNTLASGDIFEVGIKKINSQLRTWTTNLPV